jgi:hypothetical protein
MADPAPPVLDDAQKAALDALVEDGEASGFYELLETKAPALLQAWIMGKSSPSAVATAARQEGLDSLDTCLETATATLPRP